MDDAIGGSSAYSSNRSSQDHSSSGGGGGGGGSGGGNGATGDFECNICLELAHDPVVTLCGHLFCWPCLYRWLHIHSHCDCPVCKALVQEDKLVPLYGRGKSSSDPRSKSIPGMEIPSRPAGQRPETAPASNPVHSTPQTFGFMGSPMATARFGSFTFSAGFGLFPSLFGFHMHGFPDASAYGVATGFPYGVSHTFHGGHAHGYHHPPPQGHHENMLHRYFVMVGLLVLFLFLLL